MDFLGQKGAVWCKICWNLCRLRYCPYSYPLGLEIQIQTSYRKLCIPTRVITLVPHRVTLYYYWHTVLLACGPKVMLMCISLDLMMILACALYTTVILAGACSNMDNTSILPGDNLQLKQIQHYELFKHWTNLMITAGTMLTISSPSPENKDKHACT